MSKIFISHSSQDNAKALAVALWLEQNGWGDYFLDITPSRGLSSGERWQAALKTATDRCEAVLFLISPAWRDSKWCSAEFLLAKLLGKTIFGVIVEPTPIETLPNEMTAEWYLCDVTAGEDWQMFQVFRDQIVPRTQVSLAGAGLASLKYGLQKAGLDPSVFPWPPPNDLNRLPYRGLKALEAEDAAVFFGREAPLIRALDTLRRMEASGEQHFVILGASGAGKSSFLRAGLWPRLKRDDRHFLPLPVIRPERAAISGQSGLLESLEDTFRQQKAPKTRAHLRDCLTKPAGIVELVTELQTLAQKRLGREVAPPTIVVCLDQAEELFGKDAGEEVQLLNLLGRLLGQATGEGSSEEQRMPRVMVITAIRSDSYEPLQTVPALAGITPTLFNLPPLAPAEYKMVIEGPAARSTAAGRKLTIEPALTERLLQDAEGADALPLLAFILERLLLDCGADHDLVLKEYKDLGGLQGSIDAAVKAAWNDPDREPVIPADEMARRMLLNQAFPLLVTIDEYSEKPKRLVATWSIVPRETHPLLDRLVTARLLIKDRRKLTDGQDAIVVEVAHEALFRDWPRLREWIHISSDDLRLIRYAEMMATRWHATGARSDELWKHERAEEVIQALERVSKNPSTKLQMMLHPQEILIERLSNALLSHQDRLLIGQKLAEFGDLRAGVGLRSDGLPDIKWIEIPGGKLKLEGGDRVFEVKPFCIAKYPVTNEQFGAFLKAEDGYRNSRWWVSIEQSRGAVQPKWQEANCPRENVSWYEAMAFCCWISDKTGTSIRLPAEEEWTQAAMGGDPGRMYPWEAHSPLSHPRYSHLWKDGWDLSRGNKYQSELRRTTAVGMYPNGATLQGVLDMAGNVWEWCLNSDQNMDNGSRRVCRGGSWGHEAGPPTSITQGCPADGRTSDIGFRLVLDIGTSSSGRIKGH